MERKFTVKAFAVSYSILFLFQPLLSRVKYTVLYLTTHKIPVYFRFCLPEFKI
jgi:hypothetical protein